MSRKPSPARRPTVKPKRRAQNKKKQANVLDLAVAALPISDATLHKITVWGITGIAAASVLGVATLFGVPGIVGTAVAEGIGRAGFRVEQVDVQGIKRADAATVYAYTLDQKSQAMPLVDLDEVRGKLMTIGWVADARVSRRMPDTLVVRIVERKAAAVWQHQGQLMLIDSEGVLLEPVSAEAMPDLPLVIGDGAYAQQPAYQKLLDAAPALKPLVKAATWIGNRRWDLTFNTGERLALPEGEEAAGKALTKFAEMDGADRLLGRGYLKFDMRDPTRLVVRMPRQVVSKPIETASVSE
ncbi:FtsQ-type POTRA domain-containing protein [Sphingomonas sp. BT-65]|uniref:cell division protein FtsQ/DivIB n=1 Tax=Sphingomonas sp. BT-65 TaxID=2989821 RepID=UPI0022356AD8|nr:cell division protein FtsQ/DivIB [Sphingomonas sp. BT-65]MCW4463075.1 FtsQ-type POTRA domain-containing protein [Sphingomonas sp. BT-65]